MKDAGKGIAEVTHTQKPGSGRISAAWVSTVLAPSLAWGAGCAEPGAGMSVCLERVRMESPKQPQMLRKSGV